MKTLLLLSSILFTLFVFSQDKYINRGKLKSKNFVTSVPYIMKNQKIIIDVEINGKTYKFLFDTGAPNMIATEILKDVEFKTLKTINVRDVNNDKERMQMVSIDELKLGDAIYKKSTAITIKKSENMVFQCFGIDGIIGSNLIRNSIVRIDAIKKELQFSDRLDLLDIPEFAKSAEMVFKDNQSSPFIKVHLLGNNWKRGHEYAMFDSGMGGLFDLAVGNLAVYQKDTLFSDIWSGTGSSSIGLFAETNKQKEYRVLIPALSIGDGHLLNLTTISTVSKKSRFGAEILDYCSMTLDYKNKNFYFEWKADSMDVNEPQYDFTPTLFEGKMAVGSVWTESLSEKLEYGDLILKFNDIDVSNINICELITKESIYRKWLEAEITFKKKNGEILKMKMRKKFLNE